MAVAPHNTSFDQIDRLVAAFYARVRKDETLGPIFMRAIGTDDVSWSRHEAHIASFWRNALGLDRGFSGNPMMKHLANGEIQPEHFPIWLGLFRETAHELLSQPEAKTIADLADRIGRSLSMGLTQFRAPPSGPPRFLSPS